MANSFLILILYCLCLQFNSIESVVSRRITPISHNHTEWLIQNCGIKRNIITRKRDIGFKIYGGHETNDFDYPWAVGIKIRTFCNEEGSPRILMLTTKCTGSLISNKHVLTSQHCFTNKWKTRDSDVTRNQYGTETPFPARIIAGHGNPTLNLTHETDEIARYVPDLNYFDDRYKRSKYDWALLELKEEVPQDLMDRKAIVPVCLPANNELVDSFDQVEVYGQGGTEINPNESSVGGGRMRYLHTVIKSTKVYEDPTNQQFLYQDLISVQSHISRRGDSGGGVTKVIQDPTTGQCRYMLIGVTKGPITNTTVAVDVRSFTDTAQQLTGITI